MILFFPNRFFDFLFSDFLTLPPPLSFLFYFFIFLTPHSVPAGMYGILRIVYFWYRSMRVKYTSH